MMIHKKCSLSANNGTVELIIFKRFLLKSTLLKKIKSL